MVVQAILRLIRLMHQMVETLYSLLLQLLGAVVEQVLVPLHHTLVMVKTVVQAVVVVTVAPAVVVMFLALRLHKVMTVDRL